MERFQLFGDHLGHGLMDAPVKVHRNAEIVAGGLANRRDSFHYSRDLAKGIDVVHLLRGIHFDRRESTRYLFPGGVADIRRAITANP